jgi:glycosyltransferase involved in cell wall biosynthesis
VSNPLVSIIVPSFNQGQFIRETIESCLAQDYRPIEVLVLDGASTDSTLDVLRGFDGVPEVRWISEPDSGVVEAVNKGLTQARGEFAGIQSSDDYYLPGAIAAGVRTLQAEPDLGFVYGDIAKVDADGKELSRTRLLPYSLESFLAVETWVPQPSTFFRLELARVLGGWREDVPYAADTDLWLRLAFRAGARKLDQVLAARRVHGEQRDKQAARIARDYSRMVDESADVAGAPVRLRRAAHAGKCLTRVRYNPTGSDWYAAGQLLRAGWLRPRCFSLRVFLLYLLYFPARKALAPWKRRLLARAPGLSPRSATGG